MAQPYRRPVFETLMTRLDEPRRFIQVLSGPRQAGKTTLVRQAMEASSLSTRYASADDAGLRDRAWLEAEWDVARLVAEEHGGAILILDEVQKVTGWADTVKSLWDQDARVHRDLRVVVLGPAPLLLQRGLGESLAGRFEIIRVPHWSFPEMRDAFGWSLDRYVFFGGYPGSAPLVRDLVRWSAYILDSLVETTLSRDILLLTRVDKPALLRQLFRLGCDYSAQVLSYQKMLGQLQDAGNTTTLAHYLQLLDGAGLLTGLQRFSGSRVRQRGSIPKLLALNTALVSAGAGIGLREARRDPALWGRLVESAVGAHLVNRGAADRVEVFYWRDRNREVDYVVRKGKRLLAIEVKTGRGHDTLPGMDAFRKQFPEAKPMIIGPGGLELEEFLSRPAGVWLEVS